MGWEKYNQAGVQIKKYPIIKNAELNFFIKYMHNFYRTLDDSGFDELTCMAEEVSFSFFIWKSLPMYTRISIIYCKL